jgi:hypothetical protein
MRQTSKKDASRRRNGLLRLCAVRFTTNKKGAQLSKSNTYLQGFIERNNQEIAIAMEFARRRDMFQDGFALPPMTSLAAILFANPQDTSLPTLPLILDPPAKLPGFSELVRGELIRDVNLLCPHSPFEGANYHNATTSTAPPAISPPASPYAHPKISSYEPHNESETESARSEASSPRCAGQLLECAGDLDLLATAAEQEIIDSDKRQPTRKRRSSHALGIFNYFIATSMHCQAAFFFCWSKFHPGCAPPPSLLPLTNLFGFFSKTRSYFFKSSNHFSWSFFVRKLYPFFCSFSFFLT